MTEKMVAPTRVAVFAGSFDPFTLGHLDIAERACKLFDELWILLAVNTSKKYMLTGECRETLVREAVAHLPNVKVAFHDGLTVDFMKSVGAQYLVRGIRTGADLDFEQSVSWNNQVLFPECETVLLSSKPEHLAISSTVVRELVKCGVGNSAEGKESLRRFLPECALKFLIK